MTKNCPACGFVSSAEARFCRMCGAMLPRAANDRGEGEVSPSASTVPLTAPRPTTDSLSSHDTGSPERALTDNIRRAEFEEFLRSVASEADDAHDDAGGQSERPLTIHVRPLDHNQPAAGGDSPRADGARLDDAAPSPSTLTEPDAGSRAEADARQVAPPDAGATGELLPIPTEAAPPDVNTAQSRPATPHVATPSAAAASANAASPPSVASPSNVAAPRPSPNARPARTTEARALRLWAGALVFGVIALVVAACVFGAWYFVNRLRASSPVAASPPAVGADAKQQAQAKLAEADELLAAGRASDAVARLREAAALDPANAEPHRRLARLLVEEGARRTAIEELRAAVKIDPNDAASWRALAEAQSAEGLYADAADSYHALFGVSTDAERDDRVQLAYADALRQAGRATEAQSLYRRLAGSRDGEVAGASRTQLSPDESAKNANAGANLNANASAARVAATNSTSATTSAARSVAEIARASATDNSRADANRTSAESRPAPLPASASPKDHYERGVELWRENRSAALAEFATAAQRGSADANYYLGLNLAGGRDPRTLKRGELVAALTYFQRARRSRFAGEARRYEDSLGKEYDRRRNDER